MTNKVTYTTNGTQTVFNFSFKIFEASDLTVWLTPQGQPFNEQTDIITNYSVTIASSPAIGGSIDIEEAPAANGTLVIKRTIPLPLNTDYASVQEITGDALDETFEEISLILEDQAEDTSDVYLRYLENSGESTLVDVLSEGQMWKKVNGEVTGVTLSENPDWSTLRSDLANNQQGTAGSTIVGHYDTELSSTPVSATLIELRTEINDLKNGAFPIGGVGFFYVQPS